VLLLVESLAGSGRQRTNPCIGKCKQQCQLASKQDGKAIRRQVAQTTGGGRREAGSVVGYEDVDGRLMGTDGLVRLLSRGVELVLSGSGRAERSGVAYTTMAAAEGVGGSSRRRWESRRCQDPG
jgi:hypothetical protein